MKKIRVTENKNGEKIVGNKIKPAAYKQIRRFNLATFSGFLININKGSMNRGLKKIRIFNARN